MGKRLSSKLRLGDSFIPLIGYAISAVIAFSATVGMSGDDYLDLS